MFNIAQYSLAAAAGAGLFSILGDGTSAFTIRNAAAGAAGVIAFAFLTHTFVAFAVALVEKKRFTELTQSVGAATLINLIGSIILGLLLAASYSAAIWTVVLFPLPLIGLFLGYRAVLRQRRERQRVDHIHAATQALAASPDLSEALVGFLSAVADVVSATDARVIFQRGDQITWTGVRLGEITAVMEEVPGGPMLDLLDRFKAGDGSINIRDDEDEPLRGFLEALEARSLLAAPLVDQSRVVGCLVALDRLGAEEFGEAETRLLEALVHELVITLDSYRLFSEVTEERERFHRIFEGSREGICLVDTNGIVKAWNPALEKITGYAEAELIGQPCCDKVLVRDSAQRRIEIDDIIRAAPEDEFELVTKQGPPRWISVLSGPTETAGERGWVMLVRDRTGEHAAEEAKSDFLATISHELRTPLTTIKGSLQVLGRDPSRLPPDTAEQMIDVLRRGADRLERLVLNLLFVSQVEIGGVRLISDELALADVVTDVVDRVAEDSGRVHFVFPPEDPIVRGDREKLAQALEHLVDNAQKYGGPTGTIVVRCVREDGYARVSVTDEGPGIPKADQERIFERFVRLGNILTRETQGAGVGLFIARRSIEGMGGSIWVESEGGKGATFHIRIPLAHPASVADEATGA
ncbi:MAG: ATP-binding protein [Actinomycetota bacterium]